MQELHGQRVVINNSLPKGWVEMSTETAALIESELDDDALQAKADAEQREYWSEVGND
jgi:hypothetical protein